MAYLNRNASDAVLPVRIGLIGSGWMGAFHAESIARRVPGAVLAAIADPNLESAGALAGALGTTKVTADAADLLADPAIDAVVIASPARFHSSLIGQAAAAGKHVFCEKPAGQGLEELDAALDAVDAAGVHFQIGFNRRYAADFQAAKKDLAAGIVGQPQLLRSLTRDPGTGSIGHAARIPAWTIFLETLIHDFDTLNWFNEGAEPVEVYAVADALVEPGLRDQGFLDTAVVTIRYSNGAIAVAEANFSALYGYDIRGEVFGSKGMVQAGRATETAARRFTAEGMSADTPRLNVELFRQAYTDELVDFADAVRARRDGTAAGVEALHSHSGSQRRPARTGRGAGLHRVRQAGDPGNGQHSGRQRERGPLMRLAVCAEMVFTDLPFTERVRRLHEAGFDVELWDSRPKDIGALKATGAVFSSMTGYSSGSLVDPDTADEVVRTAESLIPTALELGVSRLVVHPAELVDGHAARPVYRSSGHMWATGARTLERLGKLGEKYGVTFCLENLNTIRDHPGIPLARAKDTLALVQAAGHPNARLMLDLYHAQMGEGNLVELVRTALPYLGEIQVADVPGRCEPGTGEINYAAVARALADAGYEGTVGMEAWASGDSYAALEAFRAAFTVPAPNMRVEV